MPWGVAGAGVAAVAMIIGLAMLITRLSGLGDDRRSRTIARVDDGTGRSGQQPSPRARDRRERLLAEFDLTNLQIDEDLLIHAARGKDSILALVDPPRILVSEQDEWPDDLRVIEVAIDDEAVAYPIVMLNVHEIANDIVGGVPIAVTYCPLCDSAMVAKREVTSEVGTSGALEFGVSGFLAHSNVVMYDRSDNALWSQVRMSALSGPHAGQALEVLPVRVTMLAHFHARYPHGAVLAGTIDGSRPPYEAMTERYQAMLSGDLLPFAVPDAGQALPPKTLGLGVRIGDEAFFVPRSAIPQDGLTIATSAGDVIVRANDAGVYVEHAPEGALTVQTFYHSWSAYHPHTAVIE